MAQSSTVHYQLASCSLYMSLQLPEQAKSKLLPSLKVGFREFCAKSEEISDLQDVRPLYRT